MSGKILWKTGSQVKVFKWPNEWATSLIAVILRNPDRSAVI